MEKYRVADLDSITNELVVKLIDRYQTNELKRLKRLKDYYLGNPDIRKRVMTDPAKPNNKIANPYSSIITDTITGYFMGKPIAYQSEDKELMLKLQDVFDKNHEQTHNSKLAKTLTITGLAYEIIYVNEHNEIKIKELQPEETFMIYDNTIEANPLMAVRFYTVKDYLNEKEVVNVELYTADFIQYGFVDGDTLTINDIQPHYFNGVPVVQYKNNDELTGSFEKVIDLIDAYDLAVSDTSNNLEYFADAYLVLSGMEATEQSDIADMKENRVMVLGENGKAEWLVKSASNVEVEEFKNRLKEDIHTLSQIPNLGDESFGNATSGEALKYKLFGLENLVSATERHFKEGVEQRIKMITNIFNVKGANHDYTYVTMNFTRNLPTNITLIADVASKLVGLISHETLLNLLPFVDDPLYELERIENENQDSMYSTTFPDDDAV